MVYYAATSAHLNPELEKPGLLPQRPVFGSMYENGSCIGEDDSNPSARRPADIWMPRGSGGEGQAWDREQFASEQFLLK